MKIALIQDEIYLPSYGGGIKANRYLLEGLARTGHDCWALTRALTRSSEGPTTEAEFCTELRARGATIEVRWPDVFHYVHEGVRVDALNCSDDDQRQAYLVERLQELAPDWIIVTDDKRRCMLKAALHARPSRVVMLLQTIIQLPFGPLAVHASEEYAALMQQTAGIVVISNFAREYLREHGRLESQLLHLPVYGTGPFRDLARFDTGYVTLINPCHLKGVEIFLGLAQRLTEIEFAAVPTWGANAQVLQALDTMPNVHILPADDDIESILAQTRILLVPSLWPETFGYVVPEAMLRGIPVIASNIGGLPEAKLGVDYLVDVAPGEWRDGAFVTPHQNIADWERPLRELLESRDTYDRCSHDSRQTAMRFAESISVAPFESFLRERSSPPRSQPDVS
ncbi:MAG: glycosyltransferase family 4 protein [Planctomycetales bacterium]|nr:glycosyltransferase family 4 protein [Planctomycetales bacterium]